MKTNDLELHVRVLGWLFLLSNALILLVGVIGVVFLVGIGFFSGDMESVPILGFIGGVGLLFMAAIALPGLVAGYGLLKRSSWSRVLALVVAILSLINFPIGTAIGVYAFWVLSQEGTAHYFVGPKLA